MTKVYSHPTCKFAYCPHPQSCQPTSCKSPATFPSTSDKRAGVGGLKHKYRELTDGEKIQVDQIKDAGQDLLDAIGPANTREASLAITKVEEAVMWAVKGITS